MPFTSYRLSFRNKARKSCRGRTRFCESLSCFSGKPRTLLSAAEKAEMTVDSNKDNYKKSSSSSSTAAALQPIEGLFKDVTYYIVGNISDEVQRILNAGGAKKDTYLSEMVSHVIADDVDNDEYSEARELFELPVVTSSWVLLSVKAEKQLAKERFAPEDLVFSGVVACFTQVQEEDMKEIWAAIVYNGGYIQRKLDNHVTHLITAATSGLKYDTAIKYPDKFKIITPDWVTDSLTKKVKQDESIYHPRLVVYPEPEPEPVPPPTPTKTPEAEPVDMIPTVVTPPLPSPLPHLGPLQQQQQPSMPAHFFEEKPQPQTAPVPTTRIETSTNKPGSQRQTIAQILSQESQNRRDISNKDLLSRLVGNTTPTTTTNLGISPSSILSTSSPGNANNNATSWENNNNNNNASQAKPNGSQPGTPSAKLALARMVNSRLQAGANHHRATTPNNRATVGQGTVPRLPTPEQKFDAGSPVLPNTCTPSAIPTTSNVLSPSRKTLQNITNSVDNAQPQVSQRPSMSKISQMLGLHVLPRTPSNGNSTVTTPPSQFAPVAPQYWGHDPADKISPDLPLIGCVFYITDYHKILGSDRITIWKQIIEQFGGQVDNSYSNRITHVLCASQQSDVFHLALRDQKRVVTAYWLNDVLVKKKMFPPCQVLHLPIIYGEKKPCNNQIIAMTNFDGEERERVKQMILAIGAKYTGYLTHCNSVLICKRPEGLKFEKAKEWRIPVVNTQWLVDLVLAELDALRLPVPNKYLQLGQSEPFKLDLSKVSHLMVGWCSPLKISRDAWKRFIPGIKRNISSNENLEDSLKSCSSDLDGPARKKQRLLSDAIPYSSMTNPRVLFTGFGHSMINKLRAMVEKLGGCVIDNPRQCTHLVAKSLSRTMKFFISINVCKYIITKDWLEDSIAKEKFLDEESYALKDVEAEKNLQCDLTFSLQRARARPLFKGFIFYITPSVVPAPKDLQSIIESAGGSVIKRRLSAKQIASLRDDKGNPTFIVITCPNDVHLCRDLMARRLAVFNSEFVLTGVLRQEIDFELFRLQVI